jgi:hypothetical protein
VSDYKVGDEVRVFLRNRYVTGPDGGFVGTVTKVGRRYATATYERTSTDYRGERTITVPVEFDMETGHEKGDSYGNGLRVKTPEQLLLDERRDAALAVIKAAGIEFRPGREHGVTTAQIEALAEVVRGWED